MSEMRKLIVVAFLLLGACSSGPGKTTLIIYSPHGKELLTEFETRFEAKNPSIDVRWLDMGSQDALDRVRPSGQTRLRALLTRSREIIAPETRHAWSRRAAWPAGLRRYVASCYEMEPDDWERVVGFIDDHGTR